MHNPLASFHPSLAHWFEQRFKSATEVQCLAWPRIAAGENLLITAPTGSGKTLTAFLWAINQFVTGELDTGTTRVLYISPLKALNNDIQCNLLQPLNELTTVFETRGLSFPNIRVLTRSGDTESAERRRMLRHPPEILITTPESLNLLLSSRGGRGPLSGIKTVILDEIHDVVRSKRGVYLMSAVERLVPMSGEFQRIALSATVNPLETVAQFVAGHVRTGNGFDTDWKTRPIATIAATDTKRYRISVICPEAAAERAGDQKVWDSLAQSFVQRINANRATLLFVNSRALCEKITWKINEAAGKTVAWSHHGSLSKELRFEVEQKLKSGQLAAIVATSTLEMGIDVGYLDEVILVQSPDAISSAIQRIGRAGHGVGEVSTATIYPTHPMDFVEAAVLARAIERKDIEPIHTIDCPLDVLAQIIISMTGVETWDLDELYTELLRSTPYHGLSRKQFDLVVNMLAGRYAENHIRELRPRVSIDRLENRIAARPAALMSLYLSGGVIPDRGYYQLRHDESNARIGELDEEFVWEAQVGNVFSFGTQNWQVRKITHNDVIVVPGRSSGVAPPFWKAEPLSRDFHYSSKVGEFLETVDELLSNEELEAHLMRDYHLDEIAAKSLRDFLTRQREHTRARLPHRHHLLVETVNSAPGRAEGQQLVLHTGWGARVNRPLAMALEAGWQEAWGELPEVYASNQLLVLQLRGDVSIEEILKLVPPERIEALLRQRLEGSGFFGARFRENAGFALLLSRGRFNERKPLWMSRLQSQKLLSAVLKYEDFPILLETWRTCMRDEFDLENLKMLLGEVERGEIRVTETRSQTPSPFAQTAAWGQINTYMYMNDEPRSNITSRLKSSLLEELVFSPDLRPRVPPGIIADFLTRRQRLVQGYAPESDDDLVEWVKERTAIPSAEWNWDMPADKLDTITIGDSRLIVATEVRDALIRAWQQDGDNEAASTHIANWLQYYGPLTTRDVQRLLGVAEDRLNAVLAALAEEREIIYGQLVEGREENYWCDAGNYEVLLRFMRQASHKAFETLDLASLPLFLRTWQTRYSSRDAMDMLFETIERFHCLPLPADFWESELLPSRIADYEPDRLDVLLQQGDLLWTGAGENRIAFCFADDMDLMGAPEDDNTRVALPFDGGARYDFATLLAKTGKSAVELNRILWKGVWRGELSNDAAATLRKGIENGFAIPAVPASAGRRNTRRGSFSRWRGAIAFSGNWFRIARPLETPDLLQQEELGKDRVRVLLDRYGILFRELIARELPAFGWSRLFRSLRLMELSGEVVSGYFFAGIPGPQFASTEAWRLLQRSLPQDTIYWINAADPASMCGMGLEAYPESLPRRLASNHLVYHDRSLVMVSERNGKSLEILVPPADENLTRYFDVFRHLLYRKFQPLRKVDIHLINREPAARSPYLESLSLAFDVVKDYKTVYIQREIRRI